MNNIQKMRQSNSKIRKFLKAEGFENIHLVPHTRWSKDINIDGVGFDGVCTRACRFYLLQNKTNSNASVEKYKPIVRVYGIPVLLLNAVDYKGVQCNVLYQDTASNTGVNNIPGGLYGCHP